MTRYFCDDFDTNCEQVPMPKLWQNTFLPHFSLNPPASKSSYQSLLVSVSHLLYLLTTHSFLTAIFRNQNVQKVGGRCIHSLAHGWESNKIVLLLLTRRTNRTSPWFSNKNEKVCELLQYRDSCLSHSTWRQSRCRRRFASFYWLGSWLHIDFSTGRVRNHQTSASQQGWIVDAPKAPARSSLETGRHCLWNVAHQERNEPHKKVEDQIDQQPKMGQVWPALGGYNSKIQTSLSSSQKEFIFVVLVVANTTAKAATWSQKECLECLLFLLARAFPQQAET